MTVKATRYIYRKIGGKIVPIRVGAELSQNISKGGSSKKALDRLNTLVKSGVGRVSKSGKIVSNESPSPSEMMDKFMKKTGAVRVHHSGNSLSIDNEVSINSAQQSTLVKMSKGVRDFFTTKKDHFNIGEALREANKKPLQKKTKISKDLTEKAHSRYGETWNPEFTGYVDNKGRMLNFSEDGYTRTLDHRDVSNLVPHRSKPMSAEKINEAYRKQKSYEKRMRSKKHSHWEYLNNIKELKKADFVTGKDRGDLIKDNINYIPNKKKHILKKLKKNRKRK